MNQIEFVKAFKSTTHNAVDIAYDSQRIKALYYQTHSNTQVTQKLAIYGSLTLYMDFINLFVFLLQLLGVRRDD